MAYKTQPSKARAISISNHISIYQLLQSSYDLQQRLEAACRVLCALLWLFICYSMRALPAVAGSRTMP